MQVTYFKCGGVSLGVCVDHHIVDAFSAFLFVNSWSEFTRGLDLTIRPFLDRKLLRARNSPQVVFNHNEFPILQGTKGSQQNSNSQKYGTDSVTVANFKIIIEQLNILKTLAKKAIHKDSNALKYSRFEILAGHIWKCVCIARATSDDQESKLYYAVTGRNSRLTPPLPLGYFGSAVFRALSIARVGDLKSKPIWYAANCVCKALAKMESDYLRSTIDYLELQPDIEALSFRPQLHTSPSFTLLVGLGFQPVILILGGVSLIIWDLQRLRREVHIFFMMPRTKGAYELL